MPLDGLPLVCGTVTLLWLANGVAANNNGTAAIPPYNLTLDTLPDKQWEQEYYLDEAELLKTTNDPWTIAYPAATFLEVALWVICTGIWSLGWVYIGKKSSDSVFLRGGVRKIESKGHKVQRGFNSLLIFVFEMLQLMAMAFLPSVRWHPYLATAISVVRYSMLIFPGELYVVGFLAAAGLFVILQFLIWLPVAMEFYNFRYAANCCIGVAGFFTRFPRFSETIRDLFIFHFTLPWAILFMSPLACTHYVVEAPTVTIMGPGPSGMECWSNIHWLYVVLGMVCYLVMYVEGLWVGAFEYFYTKTSDLGYSGRFMSIQFQMKLFIGALYVICQERYTRITSGCIGLGCFALLFFNARYVCAVWGCVVLQCAVGQCSAKRRGVVLRCAVV